MKTTLKELHEICEAMDHMEVATSEILRIIVKSESDITNEIFAFEYPFKRSWDDLMGDVNNWTQAFRKSTAEQQKLLEMKNKKTENDKHVNLPSIIQFLHGEDYGFKMEYECPQYSISLEGISDNKMLITNGPTDDGEECIIFINDDEVFKSQSTNMILNQIRILSRLIGAH